MRSHINPYVSDILAQPEAVRRVVAQRPHTALAPIAARTYSRIVLTGMGASYSALLPAWLRLVHAGLPAWRIDTAALDQDAPDLLTRDTLDVAASQSGRSAEILALAERGAGTLVALTNDPHSPLAGRADVVLDIAAGEEHAVSTRSYLNTLATAALAADALAGGASEHALADAAEHIDAYLAGWRERVEELAAVVGLPERLYLLARGASLAAAEYGALILKEAAKWPAEAMSAGQFRHGPLELADERLCAIVLDAGQRRNAALMADVERFGAQALELAAPRAAGAGLALAQAVPTQLLSIAIAEQTGIEPGTFRHLDKVTTVE